MSESRSSVGLRDPEYLATVAGTVSTGGLFFYGALVDSAPSADVIGFVLAWVFVPMVVTHEVARRWL
ncbi:hypothetical protein [Haloterrigena salinisoli]|uniref:hypothetical protein n=1 Tax=Haloterrigena salinisoli TaxID=3132747 RepID=UPI0030CCB7BB